jgi:flagellar assembly protein FliH
MSSRLLSDDDAAKAQPIQWRRAGAAEQSANANFHPEASAADAGVVLRLQSRIEQLEREMEQRTRQAYQQGHAAGEQTGAQAAAARLDPVYARLARTVEELACLRRRVRVESEEDAVRLSVAIARRVLHRELAVDPDALLGIVKAAFEKIDAREVHRVRLHPEDAPVLQKHFEKTAMPVRIEILADPSLERGSAVFETSRGTLDASVSAQLGEIERGFVDLVRRSQ